VSRQRLRAVSEARDALALVAAVAVPATAATVLAGVATREIGDWFRWGAGPFLVSALLLATLTSALVVAEWTCRRFRLGEPHPVRKSQLLLVGLGVAVLLVAGLPGTWPVLAGFAIVCAVLTGLVGLGAALDL
jgi:hypothetical protein